MMFDYGNFPISSCLFSVHHQHGWLLVGLVLSLLFLSALSLTLLRSPRHDEYFNGGRFVFFAPTHAYYWQYSSQSHNKFFIRVPEATWTSKLGSLSNIKITLRVFPVASSTFIYNSPTQRMRIFSLSITVSLCSREKYLQSKKNKENYFILLLET